MSSTRKRSPPVVLTNSDPDDLNVGTVRRHVSSRALWRLRPYTTKALRDESHATLAQELAISVERGLPLTEALEASALPEFRLGGNVVWWVLFLTFTCGLVTIYTLGQWTSLLTGGAFLLFLGAVLFLGVRGDDYRRHVAEMLLERVRAGHSLGRAMLELPGLFSTFEIETVSAGEQAGRLAEALREIARQNKLTLALRHTANMFTYPVLMFFLIAVIWNFLFSRFGFHDRILDIIAQLRSPSASAPVNAYLVNAAKSMHLASRLSPLLLLLSLYCLSIFGLRAFCNGSRIGTYLWICAKALLVVGALYALGWQFLKPSWSEGAFNSYLASTPLLGFALTAWAMRTGVLRTAKGVAGLPVLFRVLPFIRGADRKTLESQFLTALRVLLLSGLPEAEAWSRAAAANHRGAWQREARRGHDALLRGATIADVLDRCTLLAPSRRASLRAAAHANTLLETLELARANAHAEAQHEASVASMVYAPLAHGLISCVALLHLILLYQTFGMIHLSALFD